MRVVNSRQTRVACRWGNNRKFKLLPDKLCTRCEIACEQGCRHLLTSIVSLHSTSQSLRSNSIFKNWIWASNWGYSQVIIVIFIAPSLDRLNVHGQTKFGRLKQGCKFQRVCKSFLDPCMQTFTNWRDFAKESFANDAKYERSRVNLITGRLKKPERYMYQKPRARGERKERHGAQSAIS